jgi:periplasmic protein TonB
MTTTLRTAAALLLGFSTLAACGGEAEETTEPRQISPSPFEYPEELWDAGVEGRTVLRLLINEEGAVDSALVEVPSGYEAFDSAAVAGSRDLRFEPKRVGEREVADWYLLPVDFAMPAGADADPTPATESDNR